MITLKNNSMIATHKIEDITFDQNSIHLQIDGKSLNIALDKISLKLKSANDLQRKFFKISPSGYGIHWPLIDEDLSVDALLKIVGQ
ncbi:hypothetical protein BH09BAC5_BH09BAC5_14180 [soil metagenome]